MPIRLEARLGSAPSHKGPFEREVRIVPNILAKKGDKPTRTVVIIDVNKQRPSTEQSVK
jgi:hypothetical protein